MIEASTGHINRAEATQELLALIDEVFAIKEKLNKEGAKK